MEGVLGLDRAALDRARISRDPRFDGKFFIAVTSTGIYCRPVCPSRSSNSVNVRYYASAATAINDSGQVVGISGACGVPVGGVSAAHALLWDDGVPTDLGNLGGIYWNTPMAINSRGEVVGFANNPALADPRLTSVRWPSGGPRARGWSRSEPCRPIPRRRARDSGSMTEARLSASPASMGHAAPICGRTAS